MTNGGSPSVPPTSSAETSPGAGALPAVEPPPLLAVVVDIELERSPDDFPDKWKAAYRGDCGLSVAVAYDSVARRPFIYDRHSLSALVRLLNSADLVISFNGKGFDLPVIEALAEEYVSPRQHYDILDEIWRQLGRREKGWGLDAVARRVLNRGKEGLTGGHAPQLWHDGHVAEVINYCLSDVLLTRDVYNFICQEKYLLSPGGEKLYIEGWSDMIA